MCAQFVENQVEAKDGGAISIHKLQQTKTCECPLAGSGWMCRRMEKDFAVFGIFIVVVNNLEALGLFGSTT